MKYSINGTGNIVAERDIYSLGGFIPKGRVGGKIASEEQLSQDGDCWLAGGDISDRPDVRIKDNAYIGTFNPGAVVIHTDGVTEFSGDTFIPGNIIVRNPIEDTKNNLFAKDSFIGVSMDVLCGPSTTASAFPFEQGGYNETAPKGTVFSAMAGANPNACRSTSAIRLGRDTYLYIPTGLTARVMWAYFNTANQLAYSGGFEDVSAGLRKLEHPIYKVCMVRYSRSSAMTPANLLATGAKILGVISGSVNIDIRPESASGQYVMDNSSLIMNTDNFGLATTQLRLLAGSMYDTTMYTKTDGQNYKLYGTFHNVERLEYIQYFSDIHRGNANRDRYITASDSPLIRINDAFVSGGLVNAGGVTLRRCIVPKASFTHDAVNGNTYEDIDFSYANDFIRNIVAGRNLYSSHREGLYACESNGELLGLISYPGNMDDSARMTEAHDYRLLDGNIIEQGAYYGEPVHYEADKHDNHARVRTKFPLPTRGATFPKLPEGFGVHAIVYLDDDFVCKLNATDPITIESTYPYYVMMFKRDDSTALSAKDFIALGVSLRSSNYNVTPEITGSAYVGAGVTVRGDVKLIGDPYVNRVFDVNMWERGTTLDGAQPNYPTWEDRKTPTGVGNRFRFINQIPIEPGAKITCNSGYWVLCYFFDGNGNYLSSPGWGQIGSTAPANSAFAGVVLKKAVNAGDAGDLIEDSDIPLANVKYLRAFEKRRYITNELDRTSPKDILIGPDYWEQGTVGGGQADGGKTYEELKVTSGTTIRLKRPINVSPLSASISSATGFVRFIRVLDAATKFHLGESLTSAKMALLAAIIQKDPSAATTPADITNARLVLEFVPQPRIIVPYRSDTLTVNGMKIRMYDNAVLSRNLNQQGEIVLQGDAVMGYDFNSGDCMCSNGHSDAIIKLP